MPRWGPVPGNYASLRDSHFLEAQMQVADTMNFPKQVHNERKRALEIQPSWYYSHSGF